MISYQSYFRSLVTITKNDLRLRILCQINLLLVGALSTLDKVTFYFFTKSISSNNVGNTCLFVTKNIRNVTTRIRLNVTMSMNFSWLCIHSPRGAFQSPFRAKHEWPINNGDASESPRLYVLQKCILPAYLLLGAWKHYNTGLGSPT